jgi:hypothetical protein
MAGLDRRDRMLIEFLTGIEQASRPVRQAPKRS